VDGDPDLDIPKLCGFGKICRAEEYPGCINDDRFGVQAGAPAIRIAEAAGIEENFREPRSRAFLHAGDCFVAGSGLRVNP
jgi:hypothetical protein